MTDRSDDDPRVKNEKLNEKLIVTKQKWAKEDRLLTGEHGDPKRDRLPPG